MSSALSGIRNSLNRMNESAAHVAGQKTDPATEIIAQIDAKAHFQANVAALDAAGQMERDAIRLWA
jgi:flagellar basal body rod protein FlgC